MIDQCKHCVVRGNIAECLSTKCSQHESWMSRELRAEIVVLKAKLPHNREPCYGPGCHYCESERTDNDYETAQAGEVE